jgi:multiple sugar transport system substrate-binding protein
MRKAIVLVLAVLIMSAPLFAGGSSDKKAASGVTKVRVWSDNASEKVIREAQIAGFNAGRGKELGIEIEYTLYGTNFYDVLRLALQSGEAPDLFRANGTYINEQVGANYIMPITDLPGGQQIVDQYKGELVVNNHIFNGKVYTLPYNITTYKLVVNKDIFDKAGITKLPTTWTEVREAAKIITQKGNGEYYGYALGLQSLWTLNSYFLRQNAPNVGHVGFDNEKLQFDFSGHLPAVDAIMGMIDDGTVFPGYEGLDADQMRAQFAAGRVGMIFGASFDVGVYNDQFPANFNWIPIDGPSFSPSGAPYKSVVEATNLLVVSAKSTNLDKVAEVFKFFYSDENMAEMYENGLYIPYRNQAIALAKKQPEARGFTEFADVPQKLILLPMPDTQIEFEGLAFREVIARYFSKSYREGAVAVFADLDKRYNDALSKMPREQLETFRQSSDRRLLKD